MGEVIPLEKRVTGDRGCRRRQSRHITKVGGIWFASRVARFVSISDEVFPWGVGIQPSSLQTKPKDCEQPIRVVYLDQNADFKIWIHIDFFCDFRPVCRICRLASKHALASLCGW